MLLLYIVTCIVIYRVINGIQITKLGQQQTSFFLPFFSRSGRMQRAMNSENMQFLFPKRVIWATVRVTFHWVRPCVVSTGLLSQKLTRSDELYTPGITLRKRRSEALRCTWHMAGWKDRGYSYQQRLGEISANRWFDGCAIANVSGISLPVAIIQ